MKKGGFIVFLAVLTVIGLFPALILGITSALAGGKINYAKQSFCFGETVWFNVGDDIYNVNPDILDRNGYFFPHNWAKLQKGIFLGVKTYEFQVFSMDQNKEVTVQEKIAVVAIQGNDGEPWVIERKIEHFLPQQRLLLLNW